MKRVKIKQRYIWSETYKGLLLQRDEGSGWIDYASEDEGSLPENNTEAKKAVKVANLNIRISALKEKRKKLDIQIAVKETERLRLCQRKDEK